MSDNTKAVVYAFGWLGAFLTLGLVTEFKGAEMGLLVFVFLAVILLLVAYFDWRDEHKDEHLKRSHEQFNRLYNDTYGQYDLREVRNHGEYRGKYPPDTAKP